MKKIINDTSEFVRDAITGLTSTSSDLARLDGWNIVVDVKRDVGHVALIAGGGAGHEPAHAGYVGAGMLTAAVVGDVYTSPSVDAVLTAIRAVASPAGVLLIIKNYTGDRMNFGLAAEIARDEGVSVELVVVADDVALARDTRVGARGLAGVVFVHKIAGAAAARGWPLVEVARWASLAAESVATMGVALAAGTVPAAGVPNFELEANEIEWGLGIHGEPGLERSSLVSAHEIATRLASHVMSEGRVETGQRVAVMVNGLGATPPGELDIVAGDIVRILAKSGAEIERVWTGNFLTALDTHGCSLSVLKLSLGMTELLDAETTAPAWHGSSSRNSPSSHPVDAAPPPITRQEDSSASTGGIDSSVPACLRAAAEAVLEAEAELTELDRIVGDGDLGTSLARGARSVLDHLAQLKTPISASALLRDLAAALRLTVGGTSGPLYSVMFLRAAVALDVEDQISPDDWSRAFASAVEGVQSVGGASIGDCTMVDALLPATQEFARSLEHGTGTLESWAAAVDAARAGAATTTSLRALLGRSSYLGDRAVGHMDPGAYAVTLWLEAVLKNLRERALDGDSA